MFAIFKRDFKSLFQNVVGWLFIGITLALFGLYFFAYNLSYGYPSIAYTLSATTFIYIITVPLLTMRAFAEERKNMTDQLLLTSPVSVGKIVFGKFLAIATTLFIVVVVMCLSPVFLSLFGTVSFPENYTAILGYFLYGLTCIAIGVLISSFTESQIIAAVLTVAVLFLGFMMNSITNLISSDGNLLTTVLNCYDLVTPVNNFFSGTLNLANIIYYISIIVLCLFLTTQIILKRRWTISSKRIRTSVFSVSAIVLIFAIVIAGNVGATFIPDNINSIDMTQKKLYTLEDETKEYLETLDQDVTIYVCIAKSSADSTLAKTLKRFEAANSHITVEYVDPEENPTFESTYTDESLTDNSMIVVCGDRVSIVSYDDIYEYSVDYTTYTQSVSAYDGEGQLVSALQYVTSDNQSLVYEITGHNETALAGDYETVFSKANMNLEEVNLMDVDSLSVDEVSGVIINGPSSDFSEDDAAKVIDYINNGGKVIITLNAVNMSDMPNFQSILNAYSVSVVDGVVQENDGNNYYQNQYYLLPTIESTDITSDLNGYVLMLEAVGMTYEESDSYVINPLLTTSDSAVSLQITTDEESGSKKASTDVAAEGPFNLGLEVASDGENYNFYIFGSYTMFNDNVDQVVSDTNMQMFKNIVSTFNADEDAQTVVVDSKSYSTDYLVFTAGAIIWYGVVWGFILPVLLILIGIIVFARRRICK